jgi:hypothetical protein
MAGIVIEAVTASDLQTVERLIRALSPEAKEQLKSSPAIVTRLGKWQPNPGPQTEAMESIADELFYGGQAGGGKTDLIVGLSITRHTKSLVLRRTNREATKLVDRYTEVLGSREGYNGQDHVWRLDDRIIDISGCQHEDDKQKFKGSPHDLIAFDEIPDFTETQYRFIIGWNRSANPKQRCRVVATGNPPTTPEGLWVLKYWAPWVDPNHPNPAKAGELRWFTTINGEDTEVDGPGPHMIDGEPITARSRTFIPARLDDNPDLAETNYASVLASLPPELRAAYKEGRFDAALKDSAFQVIPTAWIAMAQERWKEDGWKGFTMTAMGYDPAGGGEDAAVLSWRHGGWFAPLVSMKGIETADGSVSAATLIKYRRDNSPVIVDAGGGYGGAVIQRLTDNGIPHIKYNGANASIGRTREGALKFANKRAESWWRFREELDPNQEGGSVIGLPPDSELRADLAAPTFQVKANGIQIESKDELRKRLGRSPGRGDAAVMCLSEGNVAVRRQLGQHSRQPKVVLGYTSAKKGR